MSRLQGQLRLILPAILVLVLTHHVSSRSSCKSPRRYLDLNDECVKCSPEPDCPEGSYKSRTCGYGFQTECLPCLNCTTVYRTFWRPCTPTSQTKCGGCLPGFFSYMGTCIYEIRHGTTSEASTPLWRNESPTKEVQTVWAVALPSVPTAKTPRLAAEGSTTRRVSILVGAVTGAVVFVTIFVSLATVWLRRNYKRTNAEDGCDRKASPANKRSTDVISALEPDVQLAAEHRPLLQHKDESRSHQGDNCMHGTISTNYDGVSTFNKLWIDFAKAKFGVNGGCLGLPALDTYLCIDSVERDTDIELAVLKNPKYLPTLAKGESLVSPIISCSPHGLSFQNPALLSFPHCGDMTSSDVTLLVSETSLDEAPKWREASLDGSCGVSYMVKGGECLVYTSHFTLFGLKAKSKQVKIMIFSKLLLKDKFFEIHVFCVNDTPESLSVVEDQERQCGFCRTCPSKEITFLSNNKDVKVEMNLNPPGLDGWVMPTQHEQVIGYKAVQKDSNPQGQYVTFHLRAVSHETCASVHVVASQKPRSSSSVAEFNFLLSLASNEENLRDSSAIEQFLSADQSPTPESLLYYLTVDNSRCTFQPKALSQDLQEKLIFGLDVKIDTGNDFRLFADELGCDSRLITLLDQKFRDSASPTHFLLMYMELRAQKRRQSSSEMLQELAQILKKIERFDLATLIETHLQQRPYSIASTSTDSGLGPGSPNGSQLSVATSASGEPIGLVSPLDKAHLVTPGLLEGDPQNLSPTVVHPARTENQDNRSKVETEV